MHAERPGRWRRLEGLLCLALGGCVTDHDALAVHPKGESDAAGVPAPPAGDAGRSDSSVTELADSGGPAGPVEPAGPRTLTLVHGVVDERSRIAFCFAPVRGGELSEVTSAPVPRDGLAFGQSVTLSDTGGIDLEHDGIRPYVIAGDLSLIEGLDCAGAVARARELGRPPALEAGPAPARPDGGDDGSIDRDGGGTDASDASSDGAIRVDASVDAGAADGAALDARDDTTPKPPPPPPLRLGAMAVVPEGTFKAERAFVLVAAGCIGGPAFTDPTERSACGDFYRPDQPSLTPIVVATSRMTDPDKVGLQFINASVALSEADLSTSPRESSGLDEFSIARDVITGEIAPRSSQLRRSASLLGATAPSAVLVVKQSGNKSSLYEQAWPKALAAGGLDAVEDGASYTLILVGPFPSFGARAWYNGPLVSIVKNTAP